MKRPKKTTKNRVKFMGDSAHDQVRKHIFEKLNSVNFDSITDRSPERIVFGLSPKLLQTSKTLRVPKNVTSTHINSKDSLVSNTKDNNQAG